jgi:translation initiation factor eIF-2B subunit alpha
MNALVSLIKKSKSTTWMELERELSLAIATLKSCRLEDLGGRTNISLCSGCDLFMKYVTRSFNLEYMEFSFCKDELLRRGQMFAGMSLSSRVHIAEIGHSFVQDGYTVLVHGSSRVVTALLLKAAETKQFNVMMTEGRPNDNSANVAHQLSEAGIPTSIVLDCAVGAVMDQVVRKRVLFLLVLRAECAISATVTVTVPVTVTATVMVLC